MVMDVYTYQGRRPRMVMEDLTLPHQIRLSVSSASNRLSVSCTCKGPANAAHEPLESRLSTFPAPDAIAVWRQHVASVTRAETLAAAGAEHTI